MVKNDSNTSSVSNQSINPRNKYSLTLSTIREQSSEGGSTISYNQEFEWNFLYLFSYMMFCIFSISDLNNFKYAFSS